MDFHLISSEQEYMGFKRDLDKRFGMLSPKLRNEPTEFPSLLTYCLVNDLNGASVYLKHISLKNLKKILTSHNL